MQEYGTLFADDLFEGCVIERFLQADEVFETYSAFHPQLEVHRIIRVVRPDVYRHDQGFRERFLQTMQGIVRLRHTNLIAVCDIGREESRDLLYYMTDQISDPTLAEEIKNGKLFPESEALPMVSAIADILQMLAKNDLCHWQIAPENLFVAESRGLMLAEPKIRLDGIPLSWAPSPFVAPELLSDPASADIRADIYSLGAVWFFLLTGHPPKQPSPSLHLLEAVLDHDAARLLKAMLDAQPAKRPTPEKLLSGLARLPGGMTFDNPALQKLTVREIDQTVLDRTRAMMDKLQSRRLLEIKIWKYAAMALGAVAALLLVWDIVLSVQLWRQNSRQKEQTEIAAKTEAEAEECRRQLTDLQQKIQSERSVGERVAKEIATLRSSIGSEAGK